MEIFPEDIIDVLRTAFDYIANHTETKFINDKILMKYNFDHCVEDNLYDYKAQVQALHFAIENKIEENISEIYFLKIQKITKKLNDF